MTDTQMILEQLKNMQENMNAMQGQMNTMQNNMDNMREELLGKQDDLRAELRESQNQLRAELRETQRQLREELVGQQAQFREEILGEFQKQTDTLSDKLIEVDEHMSQVEHELKVYMELVVGKRITTLFDGYDTNRGHIAELRSNEKRLQRQLEDLQVRLAIVEKQISA